MKSLRSVSGASHQPDLRRSGPHSSCSGCGRTAGAIGVRADAGVPGTTRPGAGRAPPGRRGVRARGSHQPKAALTTAASRRAAPCLPHPPPPPRPTPHRTFRRIPGGGRLSASSAALDRHPAAPAGARSAGSGLRARRVPRRTTRHSAASHEPRRRSASAAPAWVPARAGGPSARAAAATGGRRRTTARPGRWTAR